MLPMLAAFVVPQNWPRASAGQGTGNREFTIGVAKSWELTYWQRGRSHADREEETKEKLREGAFDERKLARLKSGKSVTTSSSFSVLDSARFKSVVADDRQAAGCRS